jgi:hypothetical protein
MHRKLQKIKGICLSGGFLPGLIATAFCHNGIMEATSEALWKLIKLIVAVNFNGLFGSVHDHMAFVAPMKVLIQLDFQVLADLAIKIIGQLL